jgi:alanyl-tRNA synthetase
MTGEDLLPIASRVAELNPLSVVILVSSTDGSVVVITGRDALRAGLDAGRLTGEFTRALSGRGGGRDDMGQGRVDPKELVRIEEGLLRVKDLLTNASQKK